MLDRPDTHSPAEKKIRSAFSLFLEFQFFIGIDIFLTILTRKRREKSYNSVILTLVF
jgi:hypothetical protein